MVDERRNTSSSTASSALCEVGPHPARRDGRRRLVRALTAVAASGALLVPAAGSAVAAPSTDGAAAGSEAACLTATFPSDQTWTTAAAVDEWLACTGLTDGAAYAAPGITRGEAAQIAYRSVGADEPAAASEFSDVAPGAASAAAINWLAGAGIVSGYTDGEFKAERDITRDELARVLVGTAIAGATVPATEQSGEPAAVEGTAEAPAETTAEPSGEPAAVEGTAEAPAETPAGTTTAEAAVEAPAEAAGVGSSAATAYEQDAAGFMAQYGCEGTALDVVDTTSMEGATGVTTVTSGVPATVQIRTGMDAYMLEHTAAHECMHVLQHEVAGYSPETLQAMLQPYYAEDFVTSWGTVDIYEQNAECAVRSLGFPQEHSNYDVGCDETMLQAGQAIAVGQDPREVVPAG